MFTKWNKGAVLGISLLLVFIFTLTANVVFEPTAVWAETSETSEEAADESSGADDGKGSFFSGIIDWVTGVTGAVNKMWGMENGSGVAMVVNAAFYLLLIVGVLFGGKLIFNILNDAVKNVKGESSVDERYQRPTFRKK